jgi:MFS family permease
MGIPLLVLLGLVSFAVQWDFYCILPSIYYRVININQGLGNHTDISDVAITDSSGAIYGWSVAAYPIAGLIFSFPFGALNDKAGPRIALSIGMFLMVVGNALYIAPIDSIALIVAGRAVAGMGSACRVGCLAVLAQRYKGPERGQKIGQWYAFGILGMLLGPALASPLTTVSIGDVEGDSMPAALSGLLELIVWLLMMIFGPRPHDLADRPDEVNRLIPEKNSSAKQEAPVPTKTHSLLGDFSTDGQTDGQQQSRPYFRGIDENAFPTAGSAHALDADEVASNHSTSLNFIPKEGAGDVVADDDPDPADSAPLPRGIWVLIAVNTIVVFCVTTFEATLVPLIHSRLSEGNILKSPAAASIIFAFIGLFVLLSSILAGILTRCVTGWAVMMMGTIMFIAGTALSIEVPNEGEVWKLLSEIGSILFCTMGFTFTYVKIPELFAGLIISTGNFAFLMKLGQLMGLLQIGGGIARAAGPIVLGYGLRASTNVVVGIIGGFLVLNTLILAITRSKLLVRDPPARPGEDS